MFYYFKGQLIDLYSQLSTCTDVQDNELLEFINRSNVFLYVTDKMEIAGAITALYERKIIHNGGIVCHIEDLVVHKFHRNNGIATKLIDHVIADCKTKSCYKIILDCSLEMQAFYEKFNFENKNIQMACYFE